jgi:hypothetical protein
VERDDRGPAAEIGRPRQLYTGAPQRVISRSRAEVGLAPILSHGGARMPRAPSIVSTFGRPTHRRKGGGVDLRITQRRGQLRSDGASAGVIEQRNLQLQVIGRTLMPSIWNYVVGQENVGQDDRG